VGQVRTAASARGGVPQAGMRAFWSGRLVLSGVGSRRWAEWHSGAGGPVWAACKRGAAARTLTRQVSWSLAGNCCAVLLCIGRRSGVQCTGSRPGLVRLQQHCHRMPTSAAVVAQAVWLSCTFDMHIHAMTTARQVGAVRAAAVRCQQVNCRYVACKSCRSVL